MLVEIRVAGFEAKLSTAGPGKGE